MFAPLNILEFSLSEASIFPGTHPPHSAVSVKLTFSKPNSH